MKKEKQRKTIRVIAVCLAALIAGVVLFAMSKHGIFPKKRNADASEAAVETVEMVVLQDEQESDTSEAAVETTEDVCLKDAEETAFPAYDADSAEDFVPKGTATITTTDGRTVTAIANSLTMYADDIDGRSFFKQIFDGLANALPEDDSDDDGIESLVCFADMKSVDRLSGVLRVTDQNDAKTYLTPPETAELWYLGKENGPEPESVLLTDVQSIRFDREHTPDFEVRYARVTTTDGSYLSPIAYIWFNLNWNASGYYPDMEFSKDLTRFTDRTVTVSNMKRFIVTKNAPPERTTYGPPRTIECTAELKNGDAVSFTMDGYYSFWAMGKNGEIRNPDRDDLKEIDFYPD